MSAPIATTEDSRQKYKNTKTHKTKHKWLLAVNAPNILRRYPKTCVKEIKKKSGRKNIRRKKKSRNANQIKKKSRIILR